MEVKKRPAVSTRSAVAAALAEEAAARAARLSFLLPVILLLWLLAAAAAAAFDSYRDEFDNVAYDGTNGTLDWSASPWIESDDGGGGAGGGLISVVSSASCVSANCLRVFADAEGDNVYRQVDLETPGCTTAKLALAVNNQLTGSDTVPVEVSGDGGGTWTTLKVYSAANPGVASETFDITLFIASNTRVRFGEVAGDGNQPIYFDNVAIECDGTLIDGDFSEWDDGVGNEYCVNDEGGANDWTNPSILDITKFCIASNQSDEVYVLFGFDDVTLSGGNVSTACVLVDTDDPENFDIDRVICATLSGPGATQVSAVEVFSCDDLESDGCGSASLMKTYGASDYGFSNTVTGPFGGQDSFVELRFPYADLAITGGQVVFSSLISYPGNSPQNLTAPKDSIFGASGQNYDFRVQYDLDTGSGLTTPVTLAYFHARGGGGGVMFEWSTATEAGNLGFHLYELVDEGFRRLNDELIPSAVGDALTPQRYVFESREVSGEQFLLEDVDLYGVSRYHGPFELGREQGSRVWRAPRIDWSGVASSRAARVSSVAAVASARPGAAAASGFWRSGPPQGGSASAVELRVSEDGVYRVDLASLASLGFAVDRWSERGLRLSSQGRAVPFRVGFEGVGPGRAAFVEFLGEALETLYTRTNVYTLSLAPGERREVAVDRQPVPSWPSPPAFYEASQTVEVERQYHFAAPGGDPWFDTRLLATSQPVAASFPLELEGRALGAGAVRLEVVVWGVTDFPQAPDHHVVVEVNGLEVAESWFDGLAEQRLEVELLESALEASGNTLTVSLPHDTGAGYDLVHYDGYRVSYPRRFVARDGWLRFTASAPVLEVEGLPSSEVVVYRQTASGTELVSQVKVTGQPGAYRARFAGAKESARYWVAARQAIRAPQAVAAAGEPAPLVGEAEVLVVSHADFLEALEPWVAARRSEGFSVRVLEVAEVYARFAHGIVDPAAIRSLVRYGAAKLGTEFVLLVGGDTYDYHDYLGQGSMSFVPTLYVPTGPIVRYAPADPLYGDVDGDGVPEVSVGRWPVRTVAELAGVIDKTLRYGAIGYGGTAVAAADAYDVAAGYSFTAASDELLGFLPADWRVERTYLDELELTEARQLLIDEINAGVALTSYFGHSGPTLWSFQRLFDVADAAALENWGRPTVVTQWGCWNTYHVAPSYDTLGHRLLLEPDRGAAAVLGAATLTEAHSERELGRRLFARLAAPGRTLGQAVLEAKQDLAATQPHRLDVLLGWTLLGDPTLTVEP